jgi:hypothetical protein
MCSHNGYWDWIHFNIVGIEHPVFEMVHSNKRFWITAYLWNEEHANLIVSRLSTADVQWFIKLDTITASSRT